MNSCLIIGGCGFLGQHLAHDLHSRGVEVTLFDLNDLKDSKFKVIVGSVEDTEKLVDAMLGKSVVFHCASPPYHLNDWQLFYRVNVLGTEKVIKACRQAGVQKLVLTSSCSVIYNGRDLENATEDLPYPEYYMDGYTQTKMLQEKLVLEANSEQLFTCAIRPHGIFGPRDHTVSEILKKAKEGKMKFIIGDGSNIVDFTHVRNVTHGHILAAERMGPCSQVNGQALNITNDEPLPFWTFTSQILMKKGYPAPRQHLPFWFLFLLAQLLIFISQLIRPFCQWQPFLTPFKVALAGTHHYYSCEKAKKLLGYRPVISVEDGLEETLKSF